ncbi:E3 ubiquitin-protein ligase rnf14 [Rhizophlyctis rosea]|nr:E3 ubiquitin-protein ligase rnf14 [Rhizophlyctis rosea]
MLTSRDEIIERKEGTVLVAVPFEEDVNETQSVDWFDEVMPFAAVGNEHDAWETLSPVQTKGKENVETEGEAENPPSYTETHSNTNARSSYEVLFHPSASSSSSPLSKTYVHALLNLDTAPSSSSPPQNPEPRPSTPLPTPDPQIPSTFHCPICLNDTTPIGNVFHIDTCSHRLCRDCAKDVITQDVKNGKWPLACPICLAEGALTLGRGEKRDGEGGGGSFKRKLFRKGVREEVRVGVIEEAPPVVQEEVGSTSFISLDEALTVLLPEEQASPSYALALSRLSLLKVETPSTTFVRCPSSTCSAVLFTDIPTNNDDTNDPLPPATDTPQTPPVTCPYCSHEWCLACDAPDTHPNFTCTDYQKYIQDHSAADLEFETTVRQNKWKKCPSCSAVCEKIDGCNKMICKICSTTFCYVCGVAIKKRNPYKHFSKKKSGCYNKLFDDVPDNII